MATFLKICLCTACERKSAHADDRNVVERSHPKYRATFVRNSREFVLGTPRNAEYLLKEVRNSD